MGLYKPVFKVGDILVCRLSTDGNYMAKSYRSNIFVLQKAPYKVKDPHQNLYVWFIDVPTADGYQPEVAAMYLKATPEIIQTRIDNLGEAAFDIVQESGMLYRFLRELTRPTKPKRKKRVVR